MRKMVPSTFTNSTIDAHSVCPQSVPGLHYAAIDL